MTVDPPAILLLIVCRSLAAVLHAVRKVRASIPMSLSCVSHWVRCHPDDAGCLARGKENARGSRLIDRVIPEKRRKLRPRLTWYVPAAVSPAPWLSSWGAALRHNALHRWDGEVIHGSSDAAEPFKYCPRIPDCAENLDTAAHAMTS